jgi:A/G-specific adenine glycosylase
MNVNFTRQLLQWHQQENDRQMPWKGEQDPYRIWISEIILQQTRVDQGLQYYQRFITAFADVHRLADARDEEVFKLWEGLGYYSRCRNLLHTARYISRELGGVFPSTYDAILRLKGIGPYTAAAISSFAFGEKKAVVDGNVHRVLTRYFGIYTPVDSSAGKQELNTLAQSLIPDHLPAAYNQAIMDFGATVCKPRNPLCEKCALSNGCASFAGNYVDQLPVKQKRIKRRSRWLNYFILKCDDAVYIRKRTGQDIWQNLHEFVLFETEEELREKPSDVLKQMVPNGSFHVTAHIRSKPQQLSHQTVNGAFIVADVAAPADLGSDYQLVGRSNLHEYAFPRFINGFLEKHPL